MQKTIKIKTLKINKRDFTPDGMYRYSSIDPSYLMHKLNEYGLTYIKLKEKLLNSSKFHMKLKITFNYKWKERVKFKKSLLDFQIEMSQYIVI